MALANPLMHTSYQDRNPSQTGIRFRQLLEMDEVSEPLQIMATMILCFAHREKGDHTEMRQVFGKMLSDFSVLE